MPRYFAELAYKGTKFKGWQNQPGQKVVQSTIEKALFTILRQEISVVGCGRTDTGVHAKKYFLHFDFDQPLEDYFLQRLNKVVGSDISFFKIFEVDNKQHARFSATSRSYEYHLELSKNPFSQDLAFFYPQAHQLDFEKMQEVSSLLLQYGAFFPFCKSNSDAKTMNCDLTRAEWVYDEKNNKWIFHISANRFLRGMVRLIVGMSINVGIRKTTKEEVEEALSAQKRLQRSYSVPPQGLYLTEIKYPFLP